PAPSTSSCLPLPRPDSRRPTSNRHDGHGRGVTGLRQNRRCYASSKAGEKNRSGMTQNGRRSRRRDLNGFRLPSRHSCNAFSLHRVLLLTLPILHVACSREAPEVERLYIIEGTFLHYNSGVYRAYVSGDGAV